jgi:hypothetical protein
MLHRTIYEKHKYVPPLNLIMEFHHVINDSEITLVIPHFLNLQVHEWWVECESLLTKRLKTERAIGGCRLTDRLAEDLICP